MILVIHVSEILAISCCDFSRNTFLTVSYNDGPRCYFLQYLITNKRRRATVISCNLVLAHISEIEQHNHKQKQHLGWTEWISCNFVLARHFQLLNDFLDFALIWCKSINMMQKQYQNDKVDALRQTCLWKACEMRAWESASNSLSDIMASLRPNIK